MKKLRQVRSRLRNDVGSDVICFNYLIWDVKQVQLLILRRFLDE